jgi:hypothetical protein
MLRICWSLETGRISIFHETFHYATVYRPQTITHKNREVSLRRAISAPWPQGKKISDAAWLKAVAVAKQWLSTEENSS